MTAEAPRWALLVWAAIVAGLVAMLVGRFIDVESSNESIQRDNESCQTRIAIVEKLNEVIAAERRSWRSQADSWLDAAEARRKSAQHADTEAARNVYLRAARQYEATAKGDRRRARMTPNLPLPNCNPNEPQLGFLG